MEVGKGSGETDIRWTVEGGHHVVQLGRWIQTKIGSYYIAATEKSSIQIYSDSSDTDGWYWAQAVWSIDVLYTAISTTYLLL